MKLALAQINSTVGDFAGNAQKILLAIQQAKKNKCDLVIFPELALCGYPPRDLLERPAFAKQNFLWLKKISKKTRGIAALVGYVAENTAKQGRPFFNAVALLQNGKITFTYHKKLLPNYDLFDECRFFEPGSTQGCFELNGKKIGVSICEDIWSDTQVMQHKIYAMDPVQTFVKAGAELIINMSASPFHLGRQEEREKYLAQKMKKLACPLVYVNAVGANDDLIFDGASLVINQQGKICKKLASFQEDFSVVDLRRLVAVQKIKKISKSQTALSALVLGLQDYLNKNNFKKVLLGLSGGMDSALVAWLARKVLGPEHALGVALPSKFNSLASLQDAQQLAQNLGIGFRVVEIDSLYQFYMQLLGLKETKQISLTLQNLQARIRGNILMALANEEGRLLLNTGNKSELAMGYCTLYGDMAGGLAILSDVCKTLVYQVAREANRQFYAIPENIFKKAPSAELAPNQSDEADLAPYAQIDALLHYFVEGASTPVKINAVLQKKLLKRIDQNEYKRFQAPLGLRITQKAFGSGRRIPLVHKFL